MTIEQRSLQCDLTNSYATHRPIINPDTRSSMAPECRFLYHAGMKTTLNLSDDLVARAKALATRERTTLTRLIEEGLALRLRRRAPPSSRKLPALPVSERAGGLCAGVNGASNQSMFEAADS